MIQFHSLRKSSALLIKEEWESSLAKGENPLKNFKPVDCDKELHDKILNLFNNVRFLKKDKFGYDFDTLFGIFFYTLMRERGMTESIAANSEYWIYIQMKVVPDLMFKRWPPKDGKIIDKRMWKSPARLYLKSLWWFIHLLWEGSIEDTKKIFANNDISQVTDRIGQYGFRRNVYHALLKTYSQIPSEKRNSKLMKKVMVLNSVYCTIVEPELMDISLEEYSKKIFREVGVDV